MKKLNVILGLIVLSALLVLNSCTKEEEKTDAKSSVLPTRFSVNIPDAISSSVTNRATQSDTLDGNQIYAHLRNFIAVGEEAANIVENIIFSIAVYDINEAMSLTYTGDDDQREKNLVVLENQTYEGVSYQYQLTVTDAQSESNADGGKALQVFWNTNPTEGVALFKPYNIDRNSNTAQQNAMFRIDYSETGSMNYDKHMIVSIANLSNEHAQPFYVENLKMFVGKSGNIVEVYGNSDHPNLNFFTNETGFDWAFVAASDEVQNIGVAEVGLPSRNLNSTSRSEILVDNALKTVFSNQIATLGYAQEDIDRFLHNTEAPGFFGNNGFIQGGTAPNNNYTLISSKINNLTPYNPTDIANISINFK